MKTIIWVLAAMILLVQAVIAGPGEIWRGAEYGWNNYEGYPFSERASHASVVFDNKMWIIGGNVSNVKKMTFGIHRMAQHGFSLMARGRFPRAGVTRALCMKARCGLSGDMVHPEF